MTLVATMRSYIGSLTTIHRLNPGSFARMLGSTKGAPLDSITKTESADEFGTLQLQSSDMDLPYDFDLVPDDNDAQDHHEAKIADVSRPTREKYLRKINYLVHEKRDLRSALQILPQMKEDCVKPEQAHFRILINACSQVGHTKKAFELYRQFKDRDLPRHVGIYGDLFNCCAIGHDTNLGLQKAMLLRKELAEKHYIPNKVLYHTMIKAFGRCGDLETAFELVDEMVENHHHVTSETLSHLLQGCASNKQSGFRHALLIWRKMRQKQVWPKLYTYNMMLRVAKDCGLGDLSFTSDILDSCLPLDSRTGLPIKPRLPPPPKKSSSTPSSGSLTKISSSGREMELLTEQEKQLELGKNLVEMPNLLTKRPNIAHIVALAPQDTKENRLLLMGGHMGFLEQMARDRVVPDVKTISQLLALAPSTREVEEEVLGLLEKLQIEPDIDMYNQLMKARAVRYDYNLAKSTLQDVFDHNLVPNIQTFGVLAMCCQDWKSAEKFLDDLGATGTRLNNEILGALVKSMARQHNPIGVMFLLQRGVTQKLQPDEKTIIMVENFYQQYRKLVIKHEEGEKVPRAIVKEARKEWKAWRKFCDYYKEWLLVVRPEFDVDPMAQYDPPQTLQETNKNDRKILEKSPDRLIRG